MPLYTVPDLKVITRIPHDRENRPIINRIPRRDYDKIIEELNRRIDEVANSDEELITAGWIPGNNWDGTVWAPISVAANGDPQRSGMVFGAIVFEVMMNRPEDWSLGKYQINGRDIGSTTYFRIKR